MYVWPRTSEQSNQVPQSNGCIHIISSGSTQWVFSPEQHAIRSGESSNSRTPVLLPLHWTCKLPRVNVWWSPQFNSVDHLRSSEALPATDCLWTLPLSRIYLISVLSAARSECIVLFFHCIPTSLILYNWKTRPMSPWVTIRYRIGPRRQHPPKWCSIFLSWLDSPMLWPQAMAPYIPPNRKRFIVPKKVPPLVKLRCQSTLTS